MLYYAIIGDMIDSRRLSAEARKTAQKKLLDILNSVNENLGDCVASRFVITLGDEFQGLLTTESDPVGAILRIREYMQPVDIRFALGVGIITTPIYYDAALGADGPAYHNARDAMEGAKHSHISKLRIKTGDADVDNRLNVVALMLDSISANWTDKQSKAINAMLFTELSARRLTQKTIAANLGVTQSTISITLAKAGYQGYSAGIRFIREELTRYIRR